MAAYISHLHRKPGSRQEMEPVQSVELIADHGIVGDSSFGRKKRQILIVSRAVLEEHALLPGEMRENIVVDGLDVDALEAAVLLTIGTATIEIIGPCDPCGRLDEIRDGLQEQLENKRGVLARAITDGAISIGDSITQISPK